MGFIFIKKIINFIKVLLINLLYIIIIINYIKKDIKLY